MTAAAQVDGEKTNGPRSRKGALTRGRLLDAAKAVFEEDGFLEARISDIAERAGLSHGSFYHYFDSKEQIFREVAKAIEDELEAPVEAVIFDPESTATPRERIREGIRRHLVSYRDEAPIMGIIEQVSRYDDHVRAVRAEQRQRSQQQIADSIRQLQLRGLADPKLDPDLAIAALGAMTQRFPELWLVEHTHEFDFDEAVEQLSRLFSNALGIVEIVPKKNRTRRTSA
ncbi:MAG TPA: TetR/AcrR family transcriptional regulator [Frankiaceae bacterium]|nr:TetR/AcrR family transcriptional regulator [Frankiaceae bacterium]